VTDIVQALMVVNIILCSVGLWVSVYKGVRYAVSPDRYKAILLVPPAIYFFVTAETQGEVLINHYPVLGGVRHILILLGSFVILAIVMFVKIEPRVIVVDEDSDE
jgi:hypothetical protein